MATEKQSKKKKSSSKPADKPAKTQVERAEAGTGGAEPQPEMRSALMPLLWLLIPFVAVVVYGLLTKE
jgi:hypothetical protein